MVQVGVAADAADANPRSANANMAALAPMRDQANQRSGTTKAVIEFRLTV
jgi:hypothetical protein